MLHKKRISCYLETRWASSCHIVKHAHGLGGWLLFLFCNTHIKYGKNSMIVLYKHVFRCISWYTCKLLYEDWTFQITVGISQTRAKIAVPPTKGFNRMIDLCQPGWGIGCLDIYMSLLWDWTLHDAIDIYWPTAMWFSKSQGGDFFLHWIITSQSINWHRWVIFTCFSHKCINFRTDYDYLF